MSKYFHQLVFVLLGLFVVPATPKESTFIIVTLTAAGSQSDTAARYYGPLLEAHLGQMVSVVNAPGGNGLVGMRLFANQSDRCESVLLGNSSVIFQSLEEAKNGFDPMKQFVPVHGMADNTALIVVPEGSPIKNVTDLVRSYGKEGKLRAGTFSPQTRTTLQLLDRAIKIKTEIIGYRLSEPIANDLAAGRLDYSIVLSGTTGVQNLIDLGKIRPIASLSDRRLPGYEQVLTMKEQGYEAPATFYWSGFFVNKDASAACRRYLERVISMTLNSELGDKFSLQPGGPQRLLIGSEQMKEMIAKQYKFISNLPETLK